VLSERSKHSATTLSSSRVPGERQLAERLITGWYAYDQRIHGDLKDRPKLSLQAHPGVEQ